ncbi:MAG: FtsX-like permease family protein [Acidobacteriota bacterium]|nr:FtsX-like permease family protein [Acidobacteriota bacterium]
MNFVFNLAWREVRASWKRLLFFFICIGVGVGSIVALRSVISNLNGAVVGEARFLLNGDVEISSTAAFNENELRAIEQVLAANPGAVEARDEQIQTTTMSRPSDETKPGSEMLELKGIEPSFPLAGDFRLVDGQQFDYRLVENKGAVVAPLLLEKINLKVGDKIRIGSQDFEIRAAFAEEPGGTTGFRLGPRVFIGRKAFDEAGLTQFGSRNRRRILFRLANPNPDEFVRQLRTALKEATSLATVRSYKDAQENTRAAFNRAENYLSLTGLVVLVLGGIGVWNVVRVFVEQKRESIAVLKCLGASGAKIVFANLLQILSLGLLGSLFGAALAQIALWLIRGYYAESLPAQMSYNLQASAILQGVLLGLAVSALFSLLPLLKIRRIKPRLLLRDQMNEEIKRFDLQTWFIGVASLGGLLLLAIWQAGSWKVGLYFLGGLAATSLVLYAAAFLLTKLLGGLRYTPSFALRQAVTSLSRPGNQTRVVLLAVGLGAFVVLAVQSLQTNLVREFDVIRGNFPTLFLLDIQPRQSDALKNVIAESTGETVEFVPTVRSRILAINGNFVMDGEREVSQQRGQIGREYVLTYRPTLVGEEEITAGEFWQPTPSYAPEISMEEGLARQLKIEVGNTVTFDIQGQRLDAKVTSLRKLDVKNPRSTFLILFRPGALDKAPQTLIGPITAEIEPATRAALQRQIVDQFPNVTVIDTADAVAAIKRLIDNITLGISFVGGFVFFCGVLILIGSIALTKFQRIYENAIFKTLGAKRKTLLAILLAEYAVLGAAAGAIGALAAIGLSYAVAKYVFEINWQFEPNLTLIGILLTALLVVVVGALASFDVLLKKPLTTLRSQ